METGESIGLTAGDDSDGTHATAEQGTSEELFWQVADLNQNQASTPPPSEKIELHSIWVAECYTPSFASGLKEGFRRLGWTGTDAEWPDHPGTLDRWVEESQHFGQGYTWTNLGIVLRPGDHRFVGATKRRSDLHDVIDHIDLYLYRPFPGVFIIVGQCVLRQEPSEVLNEVLRVRYSHETIVTGSNRITYPAITQKEKAVRRAHDQLRRACVSWFVTHLPGVFASMHDPIYYPTCEFMTLRDAVPFTNQPYRGYDSYLSVLRMDYDYEAWRGDSLPGVAIVQREYGEPARNLVIAGRWCEALGDDESMQAYGGRDRHGLTNALHSRFSGSMVAWALAALLDVYERSLSDLRDDMARTMSTGSAAATAATLQNVESGLLRFSADAFAVVSEMVDYSANERLYYYEVARDLRHSRKDVYGDRHLFQAIRESTLRRCEHILRLEQVVRELTATASAIINARSQERLSQTNLKLQRLVIWLTVVTLLLTALSLITTLCGRA